MMKTAFHLARSSLTLTRSVSEGLLPLPLLTLRVSVKRPPNVSHVAVRGISGNVLGPVFAGIVSLVAFGCGRHDESLSEVRGDVTFLGLPAVAEVVFEPMTSKGQLGGRASTATSDAEGRFRMMFSDSQPGARIGRHRVAIRVLGITRPDGSTVSSNTEQSGTVGTLKVTQLLRDVRSEGNQFHFRLTY